MKLTASEILSKVVDGTLDKDSKWVVADPKRYYLKLDVGVNIYRTNIYVNLDLIQNELFIDNNEESVGFQTKFTDDEIAKLDIPMIHFKKVEVE